MAVSLPVWGLVNRHTGGLEKWRTFGVRTPDVNRHTGGLENNWRFVGYL